jgi:hypothetical protein
MQDETPSIPFTPNKEKFEKASTTFRELYRQHIDDTKARLSLFIDTNKQISAFYERLMLVDLGTIGLSVTALIAYASKFSLFSTQKLAVVLLISCAWMLLLVSSFLCRDRVLACIVANKVLASAFDNLVHDYHRQGISTTAILMSQSVSGSLKVGDEELDITQLFSKLSNLPNPETLRQRMADFEMELAKYEAQKNMPSKQQTDRAIQTMQIGLIFLAITAIVLVSFIK